MPSGANQNVSGRLGTDVFKGKHVLIFISEFRRDLFLCNLAKQAISAHSFLPPNCFHPAARSWGEILLCCEAARRIAAPALPPEPCLRARDRTFRPANHRTE